MNKNTLIFASTVMLAALFGATAAYAQSVDYGSSEQMFGEPVTTSATGSPQRATEAPGRHDHHLRRRDPPLRGPTIPGPCSRGSAGIDVLNSAAMNYDISVRGYDKPMSARLLVLVNGRQVYLDHYGYTDWSLIPVQLSEIRQIEVVKGPNSALFGFNAVAGVINIITYNPKFDDINNASLTGGLYDYSELSLVQSFKLGQRFSGRVSFGAAKEHQYPNDIGVAAANVYQPWRTSLAVDTITQLTDKVEWRNEVDISREMLSNPSQSYAISSIKPTMKDIKSTLTADTDFGLIEASAYENQFVADTVILVPTTFRNTVSVFDLQDMFKIGTDHTFRLSYEHRDNKLATLTYTGGTVSYMVNSFSGMWNWAVTKQLAVTAALREDMLKLHRTGTFPYATWVYQSDALWDRKVDELSYNGGVVYKLGDYDVVKLSTARGVRDPNIVRVWRIPKKHARGRQDG